MESGGDGGRTKLLLPYWVKTISTDAIGQTTCRVKNSLVADDVTGIGSHVVDDVSGQNNLLRCQCVQAE